MDEPWPVLYSKPGALPGNLGGELVEIEVPGDGSCFFHAVLNGCFRDYRLGNHLGNEVTPKEMVQLFREELAEYLAARDENGRPTYETMLGGGIRAFAEETGLIGYSLAGMQAALRSMQSVGYEFHALVSDIAMKDIYIVTIDRQRRELQPYVFDDGESAGSYYKNRPSLVLLSEDNHYRLVARRLPRSYQTVFNPGDPLISKLKEGMRRLKKDAKE